MPRCRRLPGRLRKRAKTRLTEERRRLRRRACPPPAVCATPHEVILCLGRPMSMKLVSVAALGLALAGCASNPPPRDLGRFAFMVGCWTSPPPVPAGQNLNLEVLVALRKWLDVRLCDNRERRKPRHLGTVAYRSEEPPCNVHRIARRAAPRRVHRSATDASARRRTGSPRRR